MGTRPGGFEPPTCGFSSPHGFPRDRTISSPTAGWPLGCRALPMGKMPMRCRVIAGAAHPLVSTPSADWENMDSPAPSAARLGITRESVGFVWASPSSPGSPLGVPAEGPSSCQKEGNRCSILLSYERSGGFGCFGGRSTPAPGAGPGVSVVGAQCVDEVCEYTDAWRGQGGDWWRVRERWPIRSERWPNTPLRHLVERCPCAGGAGDSGSFAPGLSLRCWW